MSTDENEENQQSAGTGEEEAAEEGLFLPVEGIRVEPFEIKKALGSSVIKNAKDQEPPTVYVEGLPTHPILRSGVLLTEIVLAILAGSLLLLIIFSWTSNYKITNFQESSHDDIFAEIHELYVDNIATEKLDEALQALRSIKANSASEAKKPDLQKELMPALKVIDEIAFRRKKIDGKKWDELADVIRAISVTPSLLASNNPLEKAVDELESLKIASLSSKDRNEIIKTLHELQKDYQEENRANRDFIVQISQMILLNLLLPVLTALLGYVFGSRSEQNNNGNNNKK